MFNNIREILKQRHPSCYRLSDNSKIASLFRLDKKFDAAFSLDDKTWADLDMPAIFTIFDTATTSIGQMYLYREMRTLVKRETDLLARWSLAFKSSKKNNYHKKLNACLLCLRYTDGVSVSKYLFGEYPDIKVSKASFLWGLFSLLLFALSVINGGIFIYAMLVVVVVNFILSQKFTNTLDKYSYGIYGTYTLLVAASAINYTKTKNIPAHLSIEAYNRDLSKLKLQFILLANGQTSINKVVGYLAYIANLLCLYDLIVFSLVGESIKKQLQLMRKCFYLIGYVDSNLAVARYFENKADICHPVIDNSTQNNIVVEDLYHPLIKDSVANSFHNEARSVLITGSNMAGKTSFMKAIGVNYILARTLFLCHATSASFPFFRLYSSINNADSLERGESFYFSELERIKDFLTLASENSDCLLLVDEIFRGTNTIERIAGAAAVLKDLGKKSEVFVTTHDRELYAYLADKYYSYYFEETGNPDTPFDYKIKKGVCKSKNAIKLMENLGFASNIIADARGIASSIDDEYIPYSLHT
ncbi:MutS-related protein [Teredinibacter turnerae]|uniref:MutS-related protein n=1 Tax=Teredinibacter turnerae TaxID=2426 RepID=UPI00037022B0|nr:hypothetical protein [Teredinibacter turnerae]